MPPEPLGSGGVAGAYFQGARVTNQTPPATSEAPLWRNWYNFLATVRAFFPIHFPSNPLARQIAIEAHKRRCSRQGHISHLLWEKVPRHPCLQGLAETRRHRSTAADLPACSLSLNPTSTMTFPDPSTRMATYAVETLWTKI